MLFAFIVHAILITYTIVCFIIVMRYRNTINIKNFISRKSTFYIQTIHTDLFFFFFFYVLEYHVIFVLFINISRYAVQSIIKCMHDKFEKWISIEINSDLIMLLKDFT